MHVLLASLAPEKIEPDFQLFAKIDFSYLL